MKTEDHSSNLEYDNLLLEIKGNVVKEALWKNINQVLIVVSELAENNAKEAILIDEKLNKLQLN